MLCFVTVFFTEHSFRQTQWRCTEWENKYSNVACHQQFIITPLPIFAAAVLLFTVFSLFFIVLHCDNNQTLSLLKDGADRSILCGRTKWCTKRLFTWEHTPSDGEILVSRDSWKLMDCMSPNIDLILNETIFWIRRSRVVRRILQSYSCLHVTGNRLIKREWLTRRGWSFVGSPQEFEARPRYVQSQTRFSLE